MSRLLAPDTILVDQHFLPNPNVYANPHLLEQYIRGFFTGYIEGELGLRWHKKSLESILDSIGIQRREFNEALNQAYIAMGAFETAHRMTKKPIGPDTSKEDEGYRVESRYIEFEDGLTRGWQTEYHKWPDGSWHMGETFIGTLYEADFGSCETGVTWTNYNQVEIGTHFFLYGNGNLAAEALFSGIKVGLPEKSSEEISYWVESRNKDLLMCALNEFIDGLHGN